jgi:hypothetical protein
LLKVALKHQKSNLKKSIYLTLWSFFFQILSDNFHSFFLIKMIVYWLYCCNILCKIQDLIK